MKSLFPLLMIGASIAMILVSIFIDDVVFGFVGFLLLLVGIEMLYVIIKRNEKR